MVNEENKEKLLHETLTFLDRLAREENWKHLNEFLLWANYSIGLLPDVVTLAIVTYCRLMPKDKLPNYAEYKKLAKEDFESKGKGHLIKDEW